MSLVKVCKALTSLVSGALSIPFLMSVSEAFSVLSHCNKTSANKSSEWSSLVLGSEVKSSSDIMDPTSFTISYQNHLKHFFSDHNTIRLDINYRKKNWKSINKWRLNNTLLNNQQVTEEINKIIIGLETNDTENTTQNLWDWTKAVLEGSLQQYKPTSRNKRDIKQPNLTPKATRKKEWKKPS